MPTITVAPKQKQSHLYKNGDKKSVYKWAEKQLLVLTSRATWRMSMKMN